MKIFNGKRKTSIAKITMTKGKGDIFINDKFYEKYLTSFSLITEILLPFKVTNTLNKYDVKATVKGGGISGQTGAIRLAIAKALCEENEEFKSLLKKEKLITRDSKIKERKKYGLKKARKAPQFSKR